jgi:hypothetical protein
MGERLDPREAEIDLSNARRFFSRLGYGAAGAADKLSESWKRPKRHNNKIERAALWYALTLEQECAFALASGQRRLLYPQTSRDTRYELQAGMRIVHAVVPYTGQEKTRLHGADMSRNFLFEQRGDPAHERLVDRWHVWLWDAREEGALLDEASVRLSSTCVELLS